MTLNQEETDCRYVHMYYLYPLPYRRLSLLNSVVATLCFPLCKLPFVLLAREKLDFAMREIIFDLLSVGKKPSNLAILPEVRPET